jgi:hypothetical protein
MTWLLVFVFVSGQREIRAEMVQRDRKGEVQCWGLAEAVNRVARDAGEPDYKATCVSRAAR